MECCGVAGMHRTELQGLLNYVWALIKLKFIRGEATVMSTSSTPFVVPLVRLGKILQMLTFFRFSAELAAIVYKRL